MGGSAALLHHFTLRWCCSLVGNRHRCVDDWRHPGDCAGEMMLKRHSSPLLLTVTCMCFSGGLAWSYQREDDSNGYNDTFKVAWGLLVESARMLAHRGSNFFFFHSEECSENNVSTTKYPCVKSTGEVTTCYRYSGVSRVVLWCLNSDGDWQTEGTLSHFRGA